MKSAECLKCGWYPCRCLVHALSPITAELDALKTPTSKLKKDLRKLAKLAKESKK